MKRQTVSWWVVIGVVVFVLVGLLHLTSEVVTIWDLDVFRVDLDDFTTSIALFAAVALSWYKAVTANRTANEAKTIATENGHAEHDLEQKEESDYLSLDARIKALERRD